MQWVTAAGRVCLDVLGRGQSRQEGPCVGEEKRVEPAFEGRSTGKHHAEHHHRPARDVIDLAGALESGITTAVTGLVVIGWVERPGTLQT